MAEQGGDRIANTPTAVWLDRIAAIQGTPNSQSNGPMGLAGAVLVDPKYPGKGLQLEIRIEDPEIFTAPWSAVVTYRRTIGPWLEQVCAEDTIDREQGRQPLMPVSAAADF